MKLKLGWGFKISVVFTMIFPLVMVANLFMYSGQTAQAQENALIFYDKIGQYSLGLTLISVLCAAFFLFIAARRARNSEKM